MLSIQLEAVGEIALEGKGLVGVVVVGVDENRLQALEALGGGLRLRRKDAGRVGLGGKIGERPKLVFVGKREHGSMRAGAEERGLYFGLGCRRWHKKPWY